MVKLFDKWSFEKIEVHDMGLKRYVSLNPVYIPHSGGRHEHNRFGKSNVNIVERLVGNLMRPGRNGGKKSKAITIVRHAFAIIHLKTGENPIQVLVNAVENSAPCEDTTRVRYGGMSSRLSVDIAPQRRLDLALRYIAEGAQRVSFNNIKSIDECLADEIILAANRDGKSYAVQKRDEVERIALSSR